MYRTKWLVCIDDEKKIVLTYYHFGKKAPKFPSRFLKENKFYEIELMWNCKLCNTLKIFFKCLLHKIVIEERK